MSKASKAVIVTGASLGIGAEVVKAFRKRDYRVVATSRSIEPPDDANMARIAGDTIDAILFLDSAPCIAGEIPHVDDGWSAGCRDALSHTASRLDAPGAGK